MSSEPNKPDEHGHEDNLQDEIAQFDALIDQHLPSEGGGEQAPRGELIEVRVVSVNADDVLVDFGGKAEARLRIEEFPMVGNQRDVHVGQMIKVIHAGSLGDGSARLSHRDARSREAESRIKAALEGSQPLTGRIAQTVKGGVMVDIGVPAFMPASQVDLFKIPDLSALVGQEIQAYVIEYDPRRKRAVLSRRRLLYEQRESRRQEMLSSIAEGQVVKGKVKSALDFGVFVDLGVVDGFVPREEVSYDRGTHPSEIVKPGTEIELKVVKIDRDTGKVTLSRKRMGPDPWDTIEERFQVGGAVKGKIIAIQNYGVFVHLEEGVTGMIHASDLSWAPGNKKPADFVKVGDTLTCKVLELNKENRRMSLGLKQIEADPWQESDKKYTKGTRVRGTVTSMTNYGAFVKLDDFIEGMIHVSDLSWEKRINHPKEVLKTGQEVDVVVLKVDPAERRVSLGLKQLTKSPFDAFVSEHPSGSIVTGKVTRFAPFGAFVELAPGLEGLIHISQIDEKRVELPEKALTLGQEVSCKIVKIEAKQQKISLSRKEVMRHAERESVRAYMKKTSDSPTGMTLGEALAQAKKEKEGGE